MRRYSYFDLLRRKFRSLYVVAVVAAVLVMVFVTPVRIYSHDAYRWWEFFRPTILVFSSGCGHLWYLRVLIIFFILAPLALFLIRRWQLGVPLMLLVMWLNYQAYWYVLMVPRSIVFFLLGGMVAEHIGATRLEQLKDFWWAQVLAGGCLSAVYFFGLVSDSVARIVLPLGEIAIISGLYDFFIIGKVKAYWDVMIFVYLYHSIPISYMGGLRLLRRWLEIPSDLMFFLALSTFFIDVAVANVIRNRFPHLYSLLTGGRMGQRAIRIESCKQGMP